MPPLSPEAAYDAAAPVYDAFTAHHDYDGWTAVVEALARSHGLSGRRLLDVGCGTGKSFLPFLARGYEVVACDVSAAMLARARAKAGGRATLVRADVRRLPRLGRFDLVLALDDVLNYVAAGELPLAFASVAANLDRGGLLVFDVNTELTYRTFFASCRSDGSIEWRGHVDPARFRAGDPAEATLEAVAGGRRIVSRHRQHHHPPAVVVAALRAAGLRCVAVRGQGLDGGLADGVDESVHTKALLVSMLAGDERLGLEAARERREVDDQGPVQRRGRVGAGDQVQDLGRDQRADQARRRAERGRRPLA